MPRYPHVSPTTATLSASVFSQLARRAREREEPPFPLHVGDTWRDPPPPAQAEAQRAEDHPRLHAYAPVQGEPDLIDAVLDRTETRTGIRLGRDEVQVMAGATAGLSVLCATLLNPGDELLLPAPYWPLIRGIVASRGATPVEVPFFDRVEDPSFDAERALEAQITERTAALYVNTPHNPTGRVLSPDMLDAITRVARRHELWVLCDEAYEDLGFAALSGHPVWAREGLRERAIACHTVSKSYGMAGARVGWAQGPREVMRAISATQTFMTYCAPRPMQVAATRALREGDEWLAEARAGYRDAGRAAADALGCRAPDGGTFLFFDASPHLRATDPDCMPFLERCLDAGVLLTPGASCGRDYARWARLCFTSVPPSELHQALDRLRQVIT